MGTAVTSTIHQCVAPSQDTDHAAICARQDRDFNAEAHSLFQLLNLGQEGAATEASARRHRYRDLDAVWRHPSSGGRVFIGNRTAASTRRILQQHGITHVVNCTSDMPLYFERSCDRKLDPIRYFRFDIYRFYRELDLSGHAGVHAFFLPVLRWIDEAAAGGHGVLIHCLAGAHRAGTTGIAYTMHASDLEATTAITACQACRPVVDPIHELRTLLLRLGEARRELRLAGPARESEADPGKFSL